MLKKVFLPLFVALAMATSCSKDEGGLTDSNSQTFQSGGGSSQSGGGYSQSGGGSSQSGGSQNTPKAVKKIVYEAVQIQKEQNFYLNSATHLGFNSTTRVSIPLHFPENTVRFYYTVSTAAGKSPVQGLKLFTQIASLLDPTGGLISSIAGKLVDPKVTTPSRADVYLLGGKTNEQNFINKESFNYYPDGSREAFTNGTIEVSQIGSLKVEEVPETLKNNYFYLGIRNPRTTTGTSVSIEVVAIVKKEIIVYE